jgi:hypothetical protein
MKINWITVLSVMLASILWSMVHPLIGIGSTGGLVGAFIIGLFWPFPLFIKKEEIK